MQRGERELTPNTNKRVFVCPLELDQTGRTFLEFHVPLLRECV